MIQAVGYLGSAGAALMWVPQAFRALRHRRDAAALAGISTTAYVVAMAFNALLLTYGVLAGARPVQLAGSTNLLCATLIVVVVARARRSPA